MNDGDHKTAFVLDICHRFQGEFTLADLIRKVTDEKPELVQEFPEIWGELLGRNAIRPFYHGPLRTYQVVPDGRR